MEFVPKISFFLMCRAKLNEKMKQKCRFFQMLQGPTSVDKRNDTFSVLEL